MNNRNISKSGTIPKPPSLSINTSRQNVNSNHHAIANKNSRFNANTFMILFFIIIVFVLSIFFLLIIKLFSIDENDILKKSRLRKHNDHALQPIIYPIFTLQPVDSFKANEKGNHNDVDIEREQEESLIQDNIEREQEENLIQDNIEIEQEESLIQDNLVKHTQLDGKNINDQSKLHINSISNINVPSYQPISEFEDFERKSDLIDAVKQSKQLTGDIYNSEEGNDTNMRWKNPDTENLEVDQERDIMKKLLQLQQLHDEIETSKQTLVYHLKQEDLSAEDSNTKITQNLVADTKGVANDSPETTGSRIPSMISDHLIVNEKTKSNVSKIDTSRSGGRSESVNVNDRSKLRSKVKEPFHVDGASCENGQDPFKPIPVDSFVPPATARASDVSKWTEAIKSMKRDVSKLKIGGEPLRNHIKDEIIKMEQLRLDLFCQYL